MEYILQITKDGEPRRLEFTYETLMAILADVANEPKPETVAKDRPAFMQQIMPLQLAYGIIRSYPDGYFSDMDDSRLATMHSGFMDELNRLDRSLRNGDGVPIVDRDGTRVESRYWYWGVNSDGEILGCGHVVRDGSKIVFRVGKTDYPLTDCNSLKREWGPNLK